MTELFPTLGAFSKEFVAALAENEARAKAAEAVAKGGAFDGPNENSNGNALDRVCAAYLDALAAADG